MQVWGGERGWAFGISGCLADILKSRGSHIIQCMLNWPLNFLQFVTFLIIQEFLELHVQYCHLSIDCCRWNVHTGYIISLQSQFFQYFLCILLIFLTSVLYYCVNEDRKNTTVGSINIIKLSCIHDYSMPLIYAELEHLQSSCA